MSGEHSGTRPLAIVSCDSHIGPGPEQLRPYCPSRYLEDFDAFARDSARVWSQLTADFEARSEDRFTRNLRTDGHFDGVARRRDLDADGVSAEVIFHGSQNGQPIPFHGFTDVANPGPAVEAELAAEGMRIYNRWLADFCAEAPERHTGLAHLPLWDIDEAVREASWAREHGLGGINFPAPKTDLPAYNRPEWEPLWSVCADLALPLCTHAGSGGQGDTYAGPEAEALQALEHGGWFARRALHWMTLSGVFERHPTLQLVLVEQPGIWWQSTLTELDSVYLMQQEVLREKVPSLPSSYGSRNVSVGASFMAPFEAEDAVSNDYWDRLLWGSDYPHMEGTFQRVEDESSSHGTIGRMALRNTFSEIGRAEREAMLAANAVRVFGLDPAALARTAERIDAPSHDDLDTPLDEVPADGGLLAFRAHGPWA